MSLALACHAELVSASSPPPPRRVTSWTLKQVQGDGGRLELAQKLLGGFIADFLCPQRALIVEVDGDTHDEGKDRVRDDILTRRGFRVVRVANDDVTSNIDGVLQHILLVLNETPKRWNKPHPNPSPEGEGLEAGVALPPSPSGEGPGVGPVNFPRVR